MERLGVAVGLLLLAVSCNGDGASEDPPPDLTIDVASDEELARLAEHVAEHFTELNRAHEDFEAQVEGLGTAPEEPGLLTRLAEYDAGDFGAGAEGDGRQLNPEEWIAFKELWGNLRDEVGDLDPPAQVEDAHNELSAVYRVVATLYAELAELAAKAELSEQDRDRLEEFPALFDSQADRGLAACEELRSVADAVVAVASRAGIDIEIASVCFAD